MSEKIKTSIHPSFKNFEDYLNENKPKYGPWKENVPKIKTESITTISAPKEINDLWKIDYDKLNIVYSEITYKDLKSIYDTICKTIKELEQMETQAIKDGKDPLYMGTDALGIPMYIPDVDALDEAKSYEKERKELEIYKRQIEQELKQKPYNEMLKNEDFKKFIQNYRFENQNPYFDYNLFTSKFYNLMDYEHAFMEGKTQKELDELYKNGATSFDKITLVEYMIKNTPDGTTFDEFYNTYKAHLGDEILIYKYMTYEQRALYHYIFKTKGEGAAQEYLSVIEDSINKAKGTAMANEFIYGLESHVDYATNKLVIDESLANVFGVGVEGLGDGINNFFQGIEKAIYSNGVLTAEDYKKMIIMQFLTEKTNYYDNVYSGSISVGNMIPAIVASCLATAAAGPVGTGTAGEVIGNTLMFTSIFGNVKNETLASGNSWGTSVLYALANAGTEVTLGHYLGNIPGLSAEAGLTLKGILMEGIEESLQSWIDLGYRSVFLGEEINLESLSATTEESIEAFWMGCIISGVMNSPDGITKIVVNGKQINVDANLILEQIKAGIPISEAMLFNYGVRASTNPDFSVNVAFNVESRNFGNEIATKTFRDFIDPDSPNYLKIDSLSYLSQKAFEGMSPEQIKEEIYNFLTDEKNFEKINNNKNIEKGAEYGNWIGNRIPGFDTFIKNYPEYRNEMPQRIREEIYNFLTDEKNSEKINNEKNFAGNPYENLNKIMNSFGMDFDTFAKNNQIRYHYGVPQQINNNWFTYSIEGVAPLMFDPITGRYKVNFYTYEQAMNLIEDAKKNGKPIPSFVEHVSPGTQNLLDKLVAKGFTESEAKIVLKCIDSEGACTYASLCNEIYEHFSGNPSKFEEYFGYPMTDNSQLILDLFLFANDVKNGGSLFSGGAFYSMTMSKQDPLGSMLPDTSLQRYFLKVDATRNKYLVNAFFKSKNIPLTYETISVKNYSNQKYTRQEINNIMYNEVLPRIANGEHIELNFYAPDAYGSGAPLEMIALDSGPNVNTKDWDPSDGHSVTVTEVQADGIVVSSWGRPFKIKFEDLCNGVYFSINSSKFIDHSTNSKTYYEYLKTNGKITNKVSYEDVLAFANGNEQIALLMLDSVNNIDPACKGKSVEEIKEYLKIPDNPKEGSLNNYEIRVLYVYTEQQMKKANEQALKELSETYSKSDPEYVKKLEELAKKAFSNRNEFRNTIRMAMKDTVTRDFLMGTYANGTQAASNSFEDLVKSKKAKLETKLGRTPTDSEVYTEIINSSTRSNSTIDMLFGLK